jgi:hypothetical protein
MNINIKDEIQFRMRQALKVMSKVFVAGCCACSDFCPIIRLSNKPWHECYIFREFRTIDDWKCEK